ncbi:hypothetical protein HNY73_004385 [Argiope bruennichi]|uniref:Uncharacterized protein n=1 Tax=Argiope bruennichi TaxID=94029 RepID=A0A8T0FRA9_ARGBR|nr:hypothetical protein HNY73_004385 [Argiope bruennichi]
MCIGADMSRKPPGNGIEEKSTDKACHAPAFGWSGSGLKVVPETGWESKNHFPTLFPILVKSFDLNTKTFDNEAVTSVDLTSFIKSKLPVMYRKKTETFVTDKACSKEDFSSGFLALLDETGEGLIAEKGVHHLQG